MSLWLDAKEKGFKSPRKDKVAFSRFDKSKQHCLLFDRRKGDYPARVVIHFGGIILLGHKIGMKITALIFTLAVSTACAAEQPSWAELSALYGHRVDSTNVVEFVHRYELWGARKFDEGSFHPKDCSFAIMFKRDAVECIILQVGKWTWGDAKLKSYACQLPFGLAPTNTLVQVMAMYGVTNGPSKLQIGDFKVLPHFENDTNATNSASEPSVATAPQVQH